MNKFVLIIIIILLLLSGGVYLFKSQKESVVYESPKIEVSKTTEPTSPTPKPVTNDDSFTSIESDLNNTLILDEDFSDL
jgi:hypothetical protein